MKIAIEEIVNLSEQALAKVGLNQSEINIVIDHLLSAELTDNKGHGFVRVPNIVKNYNLNKGEVEYIEKSPNSLLIDGKDNLGLAVASSATKRAIELAQNSNIVIVGAKNYRGTTGVMGYYARMLAQQNLISIIMCNSEEAVAPYGGREAVLGTNPICFGFPGQDQPVIVDFATAAMTYGELMLKAKAGERVPEGVVLDDDGNSSNDPNDADNGCQLPMAGPKGYGLGLAIELLTGALLGAKLGREAVVGSDGLTMIVIKSDAFVTKDGFTDSLAKLVQEIKSTKLAKGYDKIRIPGDKFNQLYQDNLAKGEIEIGDSIIDEIRGLI